MILTYHILRYEKLTYQRLKILPTINLGTIYLEKKSEKFTYHILRSPHAPAREPATNGTRTNWNQYNIY